MSISYTKTDNKDYFKKWSHNMAYILGFFTGDGCLYIKNNRYSITFSISEKDIEILEFIRNQINKNRNITLSSPIDKRSNKISYKCNLYIGNKEICNDLVSIGYYNRKTYNMPKIVVPEKFKPDFLRGLFDADGSLAVCNRKESYQKRYTWSISNINLDFLQYLKENFGNNLGKIITYKNKAFWRIDRELDIREICDYIYNGNFCLKRKYDIYQKMPKSKNNQKYELFGEEKYIYDWAKDKRCKTNSRNFLQRIRKGWSFKEAFLTNNIKNQYERNKCE